jgi:hypothetical protein
MTTAATSTGLKAELIAAKKKIYEQQTHIERYVREVTDRTDIIRQLRTHIIELRRERDDVVRTLKRIREASQ